MNIEVSMSNSETTLCRRWVETWLRAGPLLEQIRRDELRALTPEQIALAADALLEIGGALPVDRPTSGLVEQQRIFRKARP